MKIYIQSTAAANLREVTVYDKHGEAFTLGMLVDNSIWYIAGVDSDIAAGFKLNAEDLKVSKMTAEEYVDYRVDWLAQRFNLTSKQQDWLRSELRSALIG